MLTQKIKHKKYSAGHNNLMFAIQNIYYVQNLILVICIFALVAVSFYKYNLRKIKRLLTITTVRLTNLRLSLSPCFQTCYISNQFILKLHFIKKKKKNNDCILSNETNK